MSPPKPQSGLAVERQTQTADAVPAPQAQTVDAVPEPHEGGSYTRDPVTGALTKTPAPADSQSETQE